MSAAAVRICTPRTLDRVVEVAAGLRNGAIEADLSLEEIAARATSGGELVLLKGALPAASLLDLRAAVRAWAAEIPAAAADDFRGNYHRERAMVSRLQQAPHLFHDYNFNDFSALPEAIQAPLRAVFEPLRGLYNGLTGHHTRFEVPTTGPYVHPQLIQYPSGGGFFGRHWHNLEPQKLGLILSLSERCRDYRNGGTCFEIDGERVEMEARQEIGDICVWRYDLPHWVTQSDLADKFDWSDDGGRWVATFAFFDPHA